MAPQGAHVHHTSTSSLLAGQPYNTFFAFFWDGAHGYSCVVCFYIRGYFKALRASAAVTFSFGGTFVHNVGQ